MTITTAARRIARDANRWRGTGQDGWLVYNLDGTGGELYTGGTSVHALRASGAVVIAVPQAAQRSVKAAEVQAMLDEEYSE